MGFNSPGNWRHGGQVVYHYRAAATILAGPALVVSIVISAICVSYQRLQNLLPVFQQQVAHIVICMCFGRISCLDSWLANHYGIYDSSLCVASVGLPILKVCLNITEFHTNLKRDI